MAYIYIYLFCSHSFIDKFTTYFSATDQKVKNETDDIPLLDAATKQLQQIFEVWDFMVCINFVCTIVWLKVSRDWTVMMGEYGS